ncbi:uncharacterized protein LOC112344452 [Selaginella moellendorffii]|uniref:uncharacterized protein LOC112344452 n=1 Tax=Selaginella moellendorffii TaxID=88036 RepID=UPI000D1C3382|nr:uncharacterized protein LOC112344452 [Selaginella moellendorffii]|eukprot:XP_024525030.1 uncharacterized protein LOC112344452 [Selaginella moellendorffii]
MISSSFQVEERFACNCWTVVVCSVTVVVTLCTVEGGGAGGGGSDSDGGGDCCPSVRLVHCEEQGRQETNNLTSLRLSWRSSAISACMPPPKRGTPSPVHPPNHHHEEEATRRERPSDLMSTSLPSRS